MSNAREVLLICGPAGAGKTAVAHEWTRTRSYPCAHIPLDDIRLMVRSGYADPQDGWGPEQARQLELARGSTALLARRFLQFGFGCVIDDAIFPSWPLRQPDADLAGWERELNGMAYRVVVLLPSFEAIVERNDERHASHHLQPDALKTIHEKMEPWREG